MGKKEDDSARRADLAKRTREGDPKAVKATRAHYEALRAAAEDQNEMKGQQK